MYLHTVVFTVHDLLHLRIFAAVNISVVRL